MKESFVYLFMILTQADIQNFFSKLTFNEELHKYYVDGNPLSISVSGLIEKFKHPTDWETIKINKALREGKTPEYFTKLWKEKADRACDLGTDVHLFGEQYPLDRSLKPNNKFKEAIVKFWADLPDYIVPLQLEAQMYHLKYLFGGTSDILLLNTKTNKIYIADYKTNENLFNEFNGQRMQGPFSHLLCNNFNHYQIQLSYYQILIEQIPGVKISGRKIIWLLPTGDYNMYETENFTEILKKNLETQYGYAA